MAKFKATTSNGFTLELTVTETATSVANNTSTLSYSLVLKNGGYNFEQYQIGYSVSLNGSVIKSQKKSSSPIYKMMSDNMSLSLCSGSGVTVAHNGDGTKSIAVAFSIDMNSEYYTPGPMSGSGTMALTTIARASVPTLSSTSFNMGASITVKTNRKSSAFTHTVKCYDNSGTWLQDIGTGVGDSVSWDTSKLFAKCTTARTLSGYVKVTTYNGSSAIGDAKTGIFTATIPNTTTYQPTINSVTCSPAPKTIGGLTTEEYIQGKSYVNVKISATPKLSAEMARYTLQIDGKQKPVDSKKTSETITSDLLLTTPKVTVYAKDSRELYSTKETSVTVTPYQKPAISASDSGIGCYRCDSKGTKSDTGTALKFIFRTKWYALKSGNNNLTATITIKNGSTTVKTATLPLPTTTASGGGASNGYAKWYDWSQTYTGYTLDIAKSYTVTFTITDTIGESNTRAFSIPTADVTLHLREGGNGAAFGGYADAEKTLSVADDWKFIAKGSAEVKGTLAAATANISGSLSAKDATFSGSFKVGGNPITDFVKSHTTAQIVATANREATNWDVVKWSTGLCELHAQVVFTNVSMSKEWGSLYIGLIEDSAIPYPVEFKGKENVTMNARPMVQVTPEYVTGANFWISTYDKTVGSTKNTPMFYAVRPTSVDGGVQLILNYYVRGYI